MGKKTINLWGEDMHVVEDDSVYIFQGDVRILKREVSSLRGAIQPFRRWDNNTVHYTLTRFSSENEYLSNKVYQAINEIEHKTYLKFVPKVENDGVASYVNISLNPDKEADTASSDYIGRKEFGINNIVIPVSMLNHYTGVGVVVHEICHALGMYHEQSRADRDKYINIDFSNTSSPYQFKTYKERNESGIDIGEFDFNSIMLYSCFASAIDPYRPVMTKKKWRDILCSEFWTV